MKSRYYYEGYSGEYAWEMTEVIFDKKEETLIHGAEFPSPIKSFLDIVNRGHKVEFIKVVNFDEENFYEVKITLKDGFVRFFYLDKQTFMI